MTLKHQFILTLLMTVTVDGSLCGATEDADDEPDQKLPRMSESQVAAEVQNALPKWDKDILSVADGERWSAGIQYDAVLKAVNDSPLKAPAAKNARRIVDGERVLRVIPQLGTVRYVNNSLNWNPDRTEKLIDNETALQIASKALDGLGMPLPEFGKPRVDTQGGRDASNTSPADSTTFEMYRRQRRYSKAAGKLAALHFAKRFAPAAARRCCQGSRQPDYETRSRFSGWCSR